MRKWSLVLAALLIAGLVSGTSAVGRGGGASRPAAGVQKPLRVSAPQIGEVVVIAGQRYAVIDALRAIALIPNTYVKTISTLVRRCKAVRTYGFLASPTEVGVVAWMPTNPLACWDGGVTGGGGRSTGPCMQGFRTPGRQSFVVFAGTTGRTCAHLSTQVPGGWEAKTNRPLQGIPQGTKFLVKCQTYDSQGRLLDYVATYSARLPASKDPYYIFDAYVDTGGRSILPGVPSCTGVNIRCS